MRELKETKHSIREAATNAVRDNTNLKSQLSGKIKPPSILSFGEQCLHRFVGLSSQLTKHPY
jgi:hypothetical protein